MKTVRLCVDCPACGQKAELLAESLRYVACEHATRYLWQCPGCGDHVDRPAPKDVLKKLTDAGVRGICVVPEPRTDAPTLTYDDLLDLGLELAEYPDAVR